MARDERLGMDILIKGKKYPLLSWFTTIDVDKKRLWCHARLPEAALRFGGRELGSVSFFISIQEFERTTKENLARIGMMQDRIKEEHISESGLGVGGAARKGKPKTEEERKKEHIRRYGTEKLPPRGTGLEKQK